MKVAEVHELTEQLCLKDFFELSHIMSPDGYIVDHTEEMHINWQGYPDSRNRSLWQVIVFNRILSICTRVVTDGSSVHVLTTDGRSLCIKYAAVDKSGYTGLL